MRSELAEPVGRWQPGQAMWPGLILAVVLIASTAAGVFLCLPYWRSPQKRWRDQVLGRLAAASRKAASERQRLRSLDAERGKRERELTEKAFQLLLSRMGVEQLDPYPGIGPATLGWLRNAGYRSVADLRHARIRIHGLGPKRLADIQSGVRELIRQAQGRFEARTCPEAQEAAEQIRASAKEFDEVSYRVRARIKAAEAVVKHLQEPAAIARRVNIWKYFWCDSEELVPARALAAPLPSIEDALRAADEQVRRAFAQPREVQAARSPSRPQAPARPISTSAERPNAGVPRDAFPVAKPVAPPPSKVAPLRPAIVEPSGRAAKESPQKSAAVPQRLEAPNDPGTPAERHKTPAVLQTGEQARPEALMPSVKESKPADAHVSLMELTVQIALLVARCDGHIARNEREVIDGHLRQRFGYDPALYNRARAFAAFYESASIDVDACLQRIAATFSVAHRAALVEFAYQIAEASRGINKREAALLDKIARRLGVEPRQRAPVPPPKPGPPSSLDAVDPATFRDAPVPPPKPAPPARLNAVDPATWRKGLVPPPKPAQPVSSPAVVSKPAPEKPKPTAPTREEHLAALEIDPAVPLSADLIRRQFRLLSERYGRERVAALGSEFVTMAEQKRAVTQAAARVLIAQFGEELECLAENTFPAGLRYNPDLDAAFGV